MSRDADHTAMSNRMSDNGLETLSSTEVDPNPALTLWSTQYYRKEDMVKNAPVRKIPVFFFSVVLQPSEHIFTFNTY